MESCYALLFFNGKNIWLRKYLSPFFCILLVNGRSRFTVTGSTQAQSELKFFSNQLLFLSFMIIYEMLRDACL